MNARPEIEIRISAGDWRALVSDVDALVRETAVAAWRAGGGKGAVEISVLLADDATLRDLNARHRGRDKATNVLSFPAGPMPGSPPPVLLGDVALACEIVAAEARVQGKAVGDHVRHLVAHGVLHLLGYDHQDDGTAEAMERIERAVLAGFGVADPYAPPAADAIAGAIRNTG